MRILETKIMAWQAGAMMLALMVGIAQGAQYHDAFSSKTLGWDGGTSWTLVKDAAGRGVCRVDCHGQSVAWRPEWKLQAEWTLDVDLTIGDVYGENNFTGIGGVALAGDGKRPRPLLIASIIHQPFKMTKVLIETMTGERRQVLSSGFMPGADTRFHLMLRRELGRDDLHIAVTGDRGFTYRSDTPAFGNGFLDRLRVAGLRVDGACVDFGSAALATEDKPRGEYERMAIHAVQDMIAHFWLGDTIGGKIVRTWSGYPGAELPDPRGGNWERAGLVINMENLYRLTGDPTLRQRIQAEWNQTRSIYKQSDVDGAATFVNASVDDAGWNAWEFLSFYRMTGDPVALTWAKALVKNSLDHWMDDQLGGGMWYRDARDFKSLYQCGILMDAFEIYRLTGEKEDFERARKCYEWIESHLLREDHIYWCDYEPTGPRGKERPDDIREGGSVSFLGGNMIMGVLHARLYKITGEERYKARALRTAEGIANRLTDGKGALKSDRDAWANGYFAGEWVRDVLTLPGIDAKHKDLMRATAKAIVARARTPDGYYGGCWNGPADGPGSPWSALGSRPQQITTSGNTVNMVIAAAMIK